MRESSVLIAKLEQSGFTLLEVVISLLLLAFVLLAADALDIFTLRQARALYYFQIAEIQTHNLYERLQMLNNIAPGAEHFSQISQWHEETHSLLPQGQGTLQGSYPHYRVAVYWGGTTAVQCQKTQVRTAGCLHQDFYF